MIRKDAKRTAVIVCVVAVVALWMPTAVQADSIYASTVSATLTVDIVGLRRPRI